MAAKRLRWVASLLGQPGVIHPWPRPGFTWVSRAFPFEVPAGHWLGITGLYLATKFGARERCSMLVVNNVGSCPDNVGLVEFPEPIIVPAGVVLQASIINNANEQQWMNAGVFGRLVAAPPSLDPELLDWS